MEMGHTKQSSCFNQAHSSKTIRRSVDKQQLSDSPRAIFSVVIRVQFENIGGDDPGRLSTNGLCKSTRRIARRRTSAPAKKPFVARRPDLPEHRYVHSAVSYTFLTFQGGNEVIAFFSQCGVLVAELKSLHDSSETRFDVANRIC